MPEHPRPVPHLASSDATSLSYNVPETISYSGRHFLELALPDDAFTTMVNPPATATASASSARSTTPSTARASAGTPADGHGLPTIAAPPGVAASATGDGPVRVVASQPISPRLQALTATDVHAAKASGQQIALFTNVAGDLDYHALPVTSGGIRKPIPLPPRLHPYVQVTITTPGANSVVHGSAAGVTFTMSGSSKTFLVASVSLGVSVDGAKLQPVTRDSTGAWSHQVSMAKAGVHTIEMSINGEGEMSGERYPVSDHASIKVTVVLDAPGKAPVVVPTLVVTAPADNSTYISDSGVSTATVTGTTKPGSGGAVTTVTVTDLATNTTAQATPAKNGGFSTQLVLDGTGRHQLRITAQDASGAQAVPIELAVSVLISQPLRRLKNRFMLVETLDLSSYLGSFGVGRVLKTFTLLPGEQTTISMKSWTKSDDTRKSAASIVDSNATEAASSFDDALSAEQTNAVSQSEASNYKIGAQAKASWGFGSVAVNGSKSGTSNSARSESVKNVLTATRKQAMKASSNRNVTVDTEYNVTQETGVQESTTRTISNINVSRTLNFVFRQMNQQHVVLVHLTNARVAYYTEDLVLDANGDPVYTTDANGDKVLDIVKNYIEYPLPQLEALLQRAITGPWQSKVRDWLVGALTAVPDYHGTVHSLLDWVTPTKDGKPYPDGKYLRFNPDLMTPYTDPDSGAVFTVPGIVLGAEQIVMRTEGVTVDSVLGQGQALDDYSAALQQVTIAERQAAVAERQAQVAQQQLARTLVTDKDTAGAAIYAELFVPPASPVVVSGSGTATNGATNGSTTNGSTGSSAAPAAVG